MEGHCPLLVFLTCVFLLFLGFPVFSFTKEEFTENKVDMFCRGRSPISCRGKCFSVTKGGLSIGTGGHRGYVTGVQDTPPQDFTGMVRHSGGAGAQQDPWIR